MDGDAYDGIPQGFKDSSREHEEKNPHFVMLSGVLSTHKTNRERLLDFEYAKNQAPFQLLCGSLTLVLMDTNNDKWLPCTDPPTS